MNLTTAENRLLLRMFKKELGQAQSEIVQAGSDEARASAARRVVILDRVIAKLEGHALNTGMQCTTAPAGGDIALADLLDSAARVNLILRAYAARPAAVADDAVLVIFLSAPMRVLLRAPGGEVIAAPEISVIDPALTSQLADAAGVFATSLLNSHSTQARITIQAALANGATIVLQVSTRGVRANLARDGAQVALGEALTAIH